MLKLQKWLLVFIISALIICVQTSASLSDDSKFIPDMATKNNIVTTYLKYNQTTEAYLMDLLVNKNHHGPRIAKFSDSGMYFFYEASEYLRMYEENKITSLSKAIQSIDMAIKKDPIALNYFFKSYLLFKKGDKRESDKIFMQGIGKSYFCTYTSRGSEAFVRMISASCQVNAYNVLCFMSNIERLIMDSKFYIFTTKKLKNILNDPSFSTTDKQKIICGMASIVNSNNKAFYVLQFNIIRITTNLLMKNISNDNIPAACILKYNSDTLKEPDESTKLIDKFKKTGDTSYLEQTLYWRNFQSIAQNLKIRK